MTTTPEILQKRFALPAEMGTKDVPCIIHRAQEMRPSDRKTLLLFVYPAIMSGALAKQGGSIRPRPATQAEMAGRAGVHRTTMTRRISKLAKLAVRVSGNCEGAEYAMAEPALILDRKREFAAPNTYQLNIRTIEQLTAGPSTAGRVAGLDKYGFKPGSCWIWDARIQDPESGKSLNTTTRLVMAAYEQMGILDESTKPDGSVKEAGVLQVAQDTVARFLGINVKSVYRANLVWAKLGVLRFAKKEIKEVSPGKWVTQPQKVIYLSGDPS
jgi:hypothetical protein